MSLSLIEKTAATENKGLEALVRRIEQSGVTSLGASWSTWFAAAAEQLECDDTIDARLTDEMAETLAEAEEAIAGGWECSGSLNRLVSLYYRSKEGRSVESRLREKAAGLGLVQLETSTWSDLHKALDAAAAGRLALAGRWIDAVEASFLNTWDSYESSDVLEEEITAESVAGHHLLREGVEAWLEALATFRDSLGQVNRSAVLSLAEQGQRLLMVVQIAEQEAQDTVSRFIASWSN